MNCVEPIKKCKITTLAVIGAITVLCLLGWAIAHPLMALHGVAYQTEQNRKNIEVLIENVPGVYLGMRGEAYTSSGYWEWIEEDE